MPQLPRYAVLFKTHFWDDFATRQLIRLLDRARPGDVFVVADETHGHVSGIPSDHVVRMTEFTSEAEGYLRYPTGQMFWHNTDYQIYHFIDKYPQYDYIVICEYDCAVNVDISVIVSTMAADELGFVGERVPTPPASWYWTRTAQPYYEDGLDIVGRLVCFAAFSRGFALQLKAARQDHTRRLLEGKVAALAPDQVIWPNNEAFVGAEISRLGVAEAPLSAFGDTSQYDWAPPRFEAQLPNLTHCAFVHPVLDGPRFTRSLLKHKADLNDVLVPGSHLHTQMQPCDPVQVVEAFLQHYLRARDIAAIERLRAYARECLGERAEIPFNVARGKPATQSSTSRWSRSYSVSEDAAGAVNGQATGQFSFQTSHELFPWWYVDLELVCPVREIRIYNRLDLPSRARTLAVSCSQDLVYWRTLYRHNGAADFGGAVEPPLRVPLAEPVELRFLRLQLTETNILNLDEVEIYV